MLAIKGRLEKRHVFWFLGSVFLFGLLIRLVCAYTNTYYIDLSYYVDWSTGVVREGLFDAYHAVESLDYPPAFLFPLYLTGLAMESGLSNFTPYAMLILKFWQLAFDLATIFLVYHVLKRHNQLLALAAAALWALNPAIIFNSAYWGQTDPIMIFLLLGVFYLVERERPMAATVLFAVSCMMKFQCAYFAPVLLLFLFFKFPIKKSLKSLGAAALVVIAVFLPFMISDMIAEGFTAGLTLPFRIYFGGLGKYPYCTLNAFNIYGATGYNWVLDDSSLFAIPVVGGNFFLDFLGLIAKGLNAISFHTVSTVLLLLSVALVVFLFFKSKNKCPYLLCFILMNSIFMLTSRMHERYQIPVIIFLLIAAIKHKNPRLFGGFLATTTMVLLNQFLLYFQLVGHATTSEPRPEWLNNFNIVMVPLSIVNVILYLVTLFFAVEQLFDLHIPFPWSKRKEAARIDAAQDAAFSQGE